MIDLFYKYIQYEKRYSQHTLISYTTDLSQFSDFLAETYQLKDLSEANYNIIRSWLLQLSENKISAKSINRKIACLRSFYKFLLKEGKIKKDPTLKIIAPKLKKRLPSFVKEENLNSLFNSIDFTPDFPGQRDKLVIELLYGTGIRLSELIELKEIDINVYQKTITVLGKGNKQRIIPLNENLLDLIFIYRGYKKEVMGGSNSSEYLVVSDKGEKSYPVFINRIVKRYLNLVTTIEKKSPHVLRHSFATHLLNRGADLNAIKDLLGHSSLAATQVYTHNSLEKLKAIFDQAHPKS